MNEKIYIAAPLLGAEGGESMLGNVHAAMLMAHELMDHGFVPFCPHLGVHLALVAPRPREDWLTWGLEWVKACAALYRMPGLSEGADAEVEEAERFEIPVFGDLSGLLTEFR